MLLRCSHSFYLFTYLTLLFTQICFNICVFLFINFEKLFERFIHGRNIFWSNPLSFPYPPIPPQSLPLISPPNYICTFTFITHWIHLVLVSMCLSLGPSFGVWVVFWPHPWGKLTLPPRQLSIANGFSSKGWDFMNICWHFFLVCSCTGPFTCRHSYFEIMCPMALSFPESTDLL